MTVSELIEKLKEFPQDTEVKITDGFQGFFYEGDFDIQLFEDIDDTSFVDIGIGGYLVEE
jgi:hypothetical protein